MEDGGPDLESDGVQDCLVCDRFVHFILQWLEHIAVCLVVFLAYISNINLMPITSNKEKPTLMGPN